MNAYLRLAACAVLAWQAVAGASALLGDAARGLQHGWGERWSATTNERIALTLGADAGLWCAIRALPEGAVILVRIADREHAVLADAARAMLVSRLRHLIYPGHFLMPVPQDAIAAAQALARPGLLAWLLVLPGDPGPADRPGWTQVQREERFQLWRLQKG